MNTLLTTRDEFIKKTRNAQLRAHAPFSHFRVGAVLVSKTGEEFSGCNVESSSYSLTLCAERVAIFKAISEGVHTFTDLWLCGDAPEFTYPCGACRQVLMDLAGPDLIIHLISRWDTVKTVKLQELLPYHFSEKDLPR